MMNKKLWVGAYLVSLLVVIGTLLFEGVLGVLLYDSIVTPNTWGVPMIALGSLAYLQFILVHTIITLSVLYKVWDVIQDGVTTVTPGKAVGFLFIPFFNIYWLFRAWGGFPNEYNAFVDRYRLNVPKLSGTLFTTFPVLMLLTAIFVLPLLIIPFVTLFLVAHACDAVNNLTLAKVAAGQGQVLPPATFIGTPENPRSRKPAFALIGASAVAAIFLLAFGVYAGYNLNPKPSAEEVPATVGDYALQPGGWTFGSILGRRRYFSSRLYVQTGGRKKAIEYDIEIHPSEAEAKRGISSTCGSNTGEPIKDAAGNEVGKACPSSGGLEIQHKEHTMRISAPATYRLKESGAIVPNSGDILAFAKALPLNAGLEIPDVTKGTTLSPSTTGSSPSSPSGPATVSKDSVPDLTFTGVEFYTATNGKDKTALSKYDGKILQITARKYSTTTNSVMLQSGKNSFFAGFDDANAAEFEQTNPDERLTVKCMAKVSYALQLEGCLLIENKKIVSPDDSPEVTFTAQEYWNKVASYDVPSSVRSQKWDELRGKIIKLSGKVKSVSTSTIELVAGESNSVSCKVDPENAAMISNISEGQQVTLFSVHGVASLEHCIVVSK
jgi:hypothetical protein